MYKKLIVFDINMDWKRYDAKDERYKEKDYTFKILDRANKNQTIAILTSAWIGDALDFIKKNNITTGFLVANGGSIIYNIGTNNVEEVHYLEPDDVNTIVHHGIMLNRNIVIYTFNHKYIYVSNEITYRKLQAKSYSNFEVIKDYDQLKKICESNEVLDISYAHIWQDNKSDAEAKVIESIKQYFYNEKNNIAIKANATSSYTHFTHKDSTKLKACHKVMALSGIDAMNDILYVSTTCINRDCYVNFKNTLIVNNPDFFYEIKDAKQPKFLVDEFDNLSQDLGKETNSFWK